VNQQIGFFVRDAKNIEACDAYIVIGAKGSLVAGVNCGACGHTDYVELTKEGKKRKKGQRIFPGQNCLMGMTDPGIALGSAVMTVKIHNFDNRIMYSAGTSVIDLSLPGNDCTVAYAIPLSTTGKNIFFDRDIA
jgi:uncharacterized ferredoxin-like protein